MAQLTLLESAKRTQNRLFQGIALSIVTTDEMAAMLPFKTFVGQAITYLREGTAPSTQFIGDDGTMGTPSTGTDDLVTVPVRRIASDLDVDSLADDLSGGRDTGAQVAKKAKATWMLVKDRIANGGNTTSHTLGSTAGAMAAITAMAYGPWLDSDRFGPGSIKYTHATTSWSFRGPGDPTFGEAVPATANGVYVLRSFNRNKYVAVTLTVAGATADAETKITFASSNNEFDGLNRIMSPSQVIPSSGANGDALSLNVLDQLILQEKVRSNRAFFMNGSLIVKFCALLRSGAGGSTPDHMALPGYSGQTLVYRGIPILENDNILSNEVKGTATTLSSVYLASLDGDEGLFMGVPGTGTEAIDVEGDPRNSVVMGFRIENLGALETKAWRRTRVQWYGALGLRSDRALVRAKEIATI
jgi:hypothetical protein